MHQPVATWPYAAIFWAVFVWAFVPEVRVLRRPHERPNAQDARSKQFIQAGQGLAAIAAFTIAAVVPSAAVLHQFSSFLLGIGMMIGGAALRWHCRLMLGDCFTGEVMVYARQTVVERGAYRYVRHPSYTAGTMLFLGIGFALANWLSIAVMLLGSVVVYAYRVQVEEVALVSVLGQAYETYMTRTKRFIPFVF